MKNVEQIEREIDDSFADNDLVSIPFAQSAWTILSVVEDHHFKIVHIDNLQSHEAASYIDGLINTITYPMRVLRSSAPKVPASLRRKYFEDHYCLALKWLEDAGDYSNFCSIFPLFHAGQISLGAIGNELVFPGSSAVDHSFEAYDRFVAKRSPNLERPIDTMQVVSMLGSHISVSAGRYSIEFSREVLTKLHYCMGEGFRSRHVLPAHWCFSKFSLDQYRLIYVCLQVMAEAWFIARRLFADSGAPGMGYESSVWVPRKSALINILALYTRVSAPTVKKILEYLTFGELNIRSPDMAIQPIVDLGNGHFAISPFVITQINAERNLCVLLNQIPDDKTIYSKLVAEKEAQLRCEVIESLEGLGLDFRHGKLARTDVDLAVIDRKNKVCLCIELKWFIEPAEIREVITRSEELKKGVFQVGIIYELFDGQDERLLGLLGIDASYDFFAMVGSVNFIGRENIQCSNIPIIRVWHFLAKLKETASLSSTVEWLRVKGYLPVEGKDYRVENFDIQCGRWRSRWYGIACG